jgi:predicted dehydrogenase
VSQTIRIAVFGNGFARHTMLPCLRHVEGVRVTGIASPNVERARATAAEFGIEHVAADHRDILRAARPDLVLIATPPHRHVDQSLDALAAGAHVVCEKPTALDAAESARMLAAARAAGGRLALIDHELRFHPKRQALRDLVTSGRLGEIRHATYTLLSPARRDEGIPWTWWSDREQGGGAWGAIGSHAIDSLRALMGEVAAARGRLETFVGTRLDRATGQPRAVTSDDFATAWLRFASGAAATITISLVDGERRHQLTIAGTEGAARLDEQGPLVFVEKAGVEHEVRVADDVPGAAALRIPDTDWAHAFVHYARAIVAAIREGRGELPGAATFEDGHRNQLVLDAVRESARSETWVTVE